ncbi:unnamed protein product, partial [Prunus brigantina]
SIPYLPKHHHFHPKLHLPVQPQPPPLHPLLQRHPPLRLLQRHRLISHPKRHRLRPLPLPRRRRRHRHLQILCLHRNLRGRPVLSHRETGCD